MKITKSTLKDRRLWRPVYGRYNASVMMRRLDSLEHAGIDKEALKATRYFATKAYRQYYGNDRVSTYGFVFAIPTRVTRHHTEYADEARCFLPIVDYLDPELTQIIMSELPPVVIDEYHNKKGKAVGAIMFVPIFSDMRQDIKPALRLKLKVNKIIADTARFARDTLKAEIIGLGATLPKMTRFGKDLRKHGILTTTGHAGTVYLICKEFESLMDTIFIRSTKPITVGIVGAGSISSSSAAMILEAYPQTSIVMYDIRREVLAQRIKEIRQKYGVDRVTSARSNDDVLQRSMVIISAVTSRITIGEDIDLRGKVIIDDSQPGSFSRSDVEAHGGQIVWVVGHDNTHEKILTRRSEFRYGDEGLCDSGDVWGCEAEVAALWLAGAIHLAIDDHVDPDTVNRVGNIMDAYGIVRADWQIAGSKVDIGGRP